MLPQAKKPSIPFETWKSQFHQDCQFHNKLAAFNALGEDVLRIFWESGLEPRVKAIVDGASEQSAKPN